MWSPSSFRYIRSGSHPLWDRDSIKVAEYMSAEIDRITASSSVPQLMTDNIQFEMLLTVLPAVRGGNQMDMEKFCHKFQNGVVDLCLLDSSVNCLIASLSYAQLSSESTHKMTALSTFQNIYRTPQDLINNYFTVTQQKKIGSKISLKDSCHLIGEILGKNICVLHIVNEKFMVKFTSNDKFLNKLFIVMTITNHKTPHVFYNYLLKTSKYIFCQLCTKSSLAKSSLGKKHFCEKDKCLKCHRLLCMCKEGGFSKTCVNCKFMFLNRECFHIHKFVNCFKPRVKKKN